MVGTSGEGIRNGFIGIPIRVGIKFRGLMKGWGRVWAALSSITIV